MSHLVQILLPVYDNEGQRFSTEHYNEVRGKLTDRFGGLTSYSRAPAEGVWDSGSTLKRDDIVVIEVMVESLDRTWWKSYKREFVTTRSGSRLTTSVGGTLTGRGGNLVIIDDPLKPQDAQSESTRASLKQWYSNTLLSRLDHKSEGAIVIVMQRLHPDDLVGHVLEQ